MKLFQKSMSVLLAVVLLMTACLPAFNGAAAAVVYSEQYKALATFLADDHVRNLNNYEIVNKKSDDIITEGFNTEAGAFVYSHTVYAKDNVENSILKAANRFYYIAESLMSYTYGVGVYTAELLYNEVLFNLESYFADMKDAGWLDMDNQPIHVMEEDAQKYYDVMEELGNRFDKDNLITMGVNYYYSDDIGYYVDELGERYYPTDAELDEYEKIRRQLAADGVSDPSLTQFAEFGLHFVKVSAYEYYNVETVISYFMATGTYMNAGNWYHEFDFIVCTDKETVLLDMDSLENYSSTVITVTTGIYQFRYQRGYDSLGTTAQYFFKPTDIEDIYIIYGDTYSLDKAPVKLSFVGQNPDTVGQAAKLYTAVQDDTTTIPGLITINNAFNAVFYSVPENEYVGEYYVGNTWDSQFLLFTNEQLNNLDESTLSVAGQRLSTLRRYAETLTNEYSNAVLVNLFESNIGNIKTLQYLLTSGQQAPTRTVRGNATYTGEIENLNSIVTQFDDLFTNKDVMATIDMFLGDTLNDLLGLAPGAAKPYSNAQELVGILLKEMLYTDEMCTMIVEAIYPMIANLLLDLFADTGFATTLGSLVDWALDKLDAALTPGKLATYLDDYPTAQAELAKAGTEMYSWNRVEWDKIDWTRVDSNGLVTPLNDRDSFAAALAATFRGLRVAVLCLFCNDNHWKLGLLSNAVTVKEQAGYRDLILPLLEALGLQVEPNAVYNDNLPAGRCYSSDDYTVRARNEHLNGDSYLLDILIPLLKWVEEIVAKKPIATICKLLPNLVNFIIRDTGDNLLDGLTKIELQINIFSDLISDVYSNSIAGFLGDTAAPLDSLNHILSNFINLSTGDGVAYSLPKIHEKKLVENGTMIANHTLTVSNPGYVFLFLLRFVLTAVGYRYDITNQNLPYLIECFGIDLDGELFMGMTFADLIYNIMLHPDEALCTLLELFYPNEKGNYYNKASYTYPLDQINFYTDTLLSPTLNPSRTYGTKVVYSEMWTQEMASEVVADLGPLADNVLSMIGVEGMEEGLGAFLEDLIYGYISNDTINMLFNLLYQLLSGVDGTLGDIDIIGILYNAFKIEITPARIALRVTEMLGYVPVQDADDELLPYTELMKYDSWEDLFLPLKFDGDLGQYVPTLTEANFNWGLDEGKLETGEAFIRVISALLSPASFIFEFLLLDQPLDVFGLVSLPSYAGYQYWFIALLELLTCPAEKILTYNAYYAQTILLKESNPDRAVSNTFYYILSPILGLVDKVLEDPVTAVFNLLPNLMFFISTGAMNDLVNNIVHFAYVLLDIAKPVINLYDVLNGLLSNLDLGGIKLNLSLPLDIDFNSVVSSLLGSMLGEMIVLGTREVVDENGNVTEEDITLTLPYIDFYTLCAGKLERFESKEGRRNVRLDAAGGGDLLTALLRLVVSVLFIDENLDALLSLILNVSADLDEYDRETMAMLFEELGVLMEGFDTADIILVVLYHLVTKLTSLSTTLLDLLADSGMTITELVAIIGSIQSVEDIGKVIDIIGSLGEKDDPSVPDGGDGEQPPQDNDNDGGGTLGAFMSIFEKIKAFFDKLILFLKKTLGIA
ncbi:MAG: hypothetical protein E7523_06515 [Ruminococcaceae bacterium]|nr:hypothetical protein [Oscillospiraceae bacterium]